VIDVIRGSPAWNAGIGPGMKVLAVNTTPWSADALRAAVSAALGDATSLQLTVQNGSEVSEINVDYHLGARYPRLARNEGDDVIGAILQSRSASSRNGR
jgi:C-terminal processing protease CtpA/Prc